MNVFDLWLGGWFGGDENEDLYVANQYKESNFNLMDYSVQNYGNKWEPYIYIYTLIIRESHYKRVMSSCSKGPVWCIFFSKKFPVLLVYLV